MTPPRFLLLCLWLTGSGTALADPPVDGSLALAGDYLFRGLSQTWGRPALQAGVDWNAGRLHAGAWASNVSRNNYPGGGVELDVFADAALWQRGAWSARAGGYAYRYPGANLERAHPALSSRGFDTLEASLALQWRRWTLKYSRALGDYFGTDVEQGYAGSTRGTDYLQLDGDILLSPRWNLHLHAGRTRYTAILAMPLANGARDPDYADFSLATSCALTDRWTLVATVSHATNAAFYVHVASFRDPVVQKDLGGTRVVLTLYATL